MTAVVSPQGIGCYVQEQLKNRKLELNGHGTLGVFGVGRSRCTLKLISGLELANCSSSSHKPSATL